MASELAQKVHKALRDRGMTVSVAESCTGGLISHYLTDLPGASAIFIAGAVVYSAEAKKAILGVSQETIARYGVVSEETSREMAGRVREITGSDYSISTTGNLGPGALEGKDKGLVYVSVSGKGYTDTMILRLTGEREENKERTALSALTFLLERIEKDRTEG
ncbi:MAG: CinA family protein [Nitrospirales bacterium]|nr:CinA family protein [Nitrospirales bacterium]